MTIFSYCTVSQSGLNTSDSSFIQSNLGNYYNNYAMLKYVIHITGPGNGLIMSNLLHLRMPPHFMNIPQEIGTSNCWEVLGKFLFDNDTLLTQIEDEEKTPECIVVRILREWMYGRSHNILPVSWCSLAAAMEQIGKHELASLMEAQTCPVSMKMLTKFPHPSNNSVNIACEVGVKYSDFGIHLLQDVTGAHVLALERELDRDAERINKRILTEWLSGRGRPTTWETLVEVLNIIGKGELAKKIKEKYVL